MVPYFFLVHYLSVWQNKEISVLMIMHQHKYNINTKMLNCMSCFLCHTFINFKFRILRVRLQVVGKINGPVKLWLLCKNVSTSFVLTLPCIFFHRSTWVQGIPTPQAFPPLTTPSFHLSSLPACQKLLLKLSQHAWLPTF